VKLTAITKLHIKRSKVESLEFNAIETIQDFLSLPSHNRGFGLGIETPLDDKNFSHFDLRKKKRLTQYLRKPLILKLNSKFFK